MSRFHVLGSRNHFRRYRGRQVSFSCFALPDLFSAMPSASGLVFKFCALKLIFSSTEGVGSHFHVLRFWTHSRRYRGRPISFSCFAHTDSFSAVPRTSGPFFMFCAPGLVFGVIEGVGSLFDVLRSRTRFLRYRGCRVPFSCFALRDSLSAVPRASGPVFMFCAPEFVFDGAECVGSRFHVLRVQTHFRRHRGRRDSFSCFVLPDSFSAVPRAMGPFVIFCAPELVFGSTEGIRSRFHVLRSRNHFRRY
jgi:hypothetical protein